MREIKFRGKRIDNGKWIYGDLLQTEIKEIFFNGALYKVDLKTVGQFTGYKDKNEKEIYEGDKFKDYRRDGVILIWSVKYGKFESEGFHYEGFYCTTDQREYLGNLQIFNMEKEKMELIPS